MEKWCGEPMDHDYELPGDAEDQQPDVIQEQTTETLDDILDDDCKAKLELVDSHAENIKAVALMTDDHIAEIDEEISEVRGQLDLVDRLTPHDTVTKHGLEQRISGLFDRRRNIEGGAQKDTFLIKKEWLIARDDYERCKRLRRFKDIE